MHTFMQENSVFDGLITNLLLVLCILTGILSRAHAKGPQRLHNSESGTFIGRFPNDDAARLAGKGLRAALTPVPFTGELV